MNNLIKFFFVALIGITFFGCNQDRVQENTVPISNIKIKENLNSENNSASRYNNLTREQLIDSLSKDKDFIELGNNLVAMFENMPNRKNFHTNFNENDFKNGQETYFLNLTGYTNEQVANSVNTIDQNLSNIFKKYPQIQFDGTNNQFIIDIVEEAFLTIDNNNSLSQKNLAACQACVKKWRPRMVWATILGAVAGGLGSGGHYYGIWAGAVGGFAGAGWGAVDCLEAAGC